MTSPTSPPGGAATRGAIHRGLTLIELLLALALIVMVAALAMPAVFSTMRNQTLRKAADQVRAAWGHARLSAMRTGKPRVFRYTPQTGRYSVETLTTIDELTADMTEGEQAAPAGFENGDSAADPESRAGRSVAAADASAEDEAALRADPNLRLLPVGITFFSGDAASDARRMRVEEQSPDLADARARPILFYPDGSCSTGEVVLSNGGYYARVTLRGSTGVAHSSDLLTAEELDE